MKAITAIGEIIAGKGDREVKFRPSLKAISQLDDAAQHYVDVFSAPFYRDRFFAALRILEACADSDVSWLTGYLRERKNKPGFLIFVPGAAPPDDCIVLAQQLIKHGVTGDVPPLANAPKSDDDYTDKFEPREIAALAVAHLGVSEADAWDMTVTSFVLAMRAKYPPPKEKGPSLKTADKLSDWLDAVNSMRDKK